LRIWFALLLLATFVGAIWWLAARAPRPVEKAGAANRTSAVETVERVVRRHRLDANRLDVDQITTGANPGWSFTLQVPAGFAVEALLLDLQAEAHNLGGRLEPQPLSEGGGYGLARLDGRVAGESWRVIVVGDAPVARSTPRAVSPADRAGGRLAIVLDDAGYSLDTVNEVACLPAAIAVAVLPNASQSAAVARLLSGTGRELLLHLPMEATANHGAGPGPGAITVGESAAEIASAVAAALAVVPQAVGVNNHMGSVATADLQTMNAVMAALRPHGLYFLDSRTTPESQGERAARQAGVPVLRRDVFLDLVDDPEAIRRGLEHALDQARRDGRAVAIGHVHQTTIAVLIQELPGLLNGVELVRPSELLRSAAHESKK
jgi:uncharacterized protein